MSKRNYDHRIIGDPINIVTGANVDINYEFGLNGPIPFEWRRYYNSSHNTLLRSLGWGHTHEYDHRLQFNIDGMYYIGPNVGPVFFPYLYRQGEQISREGYTLHCVSPLCYQISQPNKPTMEFEFESPDKPTPLKRLFKDRSSIHFRYQSTDHLKIIVDSIGRHIYIETDNKGRILDLFLVEYADDQEERKTPIINYQYDEMGNLIKGVDAYRNSFSFKYDQNNRMVSKTDRRGYTFFFEYDKEGRCIHSYGEDGIHEIHLKFMPLERITVVTKADGGEWTYFYNDNGTIVQIIDPYGGAQLFNYDEQGRIIEEVDPNGNVTKWIYNLYGRVEGKMFPSGHFQPIPKDRRTLNRLEHRVASCASEWEYGDLIDRRQIRGPYFEHKIQNNQTQKTLSESGALRITGDGKVYDRFGLLVREIGPNGTIRRWNYDENGNIKRYIDRDGSQYTYEYSSWNLLKHMVDALGRVVKVSHAPSEKISKVIDPGGNESEYIYDQKDRLIEIRRHGTTKEKYCYDHADNLIEKRDSEGNLLLTFEIGIGDLKSVRRLASGENHYFEYDQWSRFTRVGTDDMEIKFEYDVCGNRIRDERNNLGLTHRFDWQRLLETTLFNRFTTQYKYHPHGIIEITDPGGQIHTLKVMGYGLIKKTMSNGSSEQSRFDYEGRCLEKAVDRKIDHTHTWRRKFQYSGEGDLLAIDDNLWGTTHYEYDLAHRLYRIISPDGHTQPFEYDATDNLLRHSGLNGVTLQNGNRLATANGAQYEYNHRNAICLKWYKDQKNQFVYDSRDFLKRVEINNEIKWEAKYDPLGRRTSKRIGSRNTEYYWDTDRLAAEIQNDGSLRVYIYADSFALVPLLFMEYESIDAEPTSGKRYFIFYNQIGTPILVEDESGKTVWSAQIDPYGYARIDPKSSITLPLRFPGHYYDAETGLHYNRFRYYNPELGRYLQSDPAGLGEDINLYKYTSSPVSKVDVRGLGCGGDESDPRRNPEDGLDAEQLVDPRKLTSNPNRSTDSPKFDGVPPLTNMTVAQIRSILGALGFQPTKTAKRNFVATPDGLAATTHSSGGSEIWMRRHPDGSYEAVRIDARGHYEPPGRAARPPHVHKEVINNDPTTWDQSQFDPSTTTVEDVASKYNEGYVGESMTRLNPNNEQVPYPKSDERFWQETHPPMDGVPWYK